MLMICSFPFMASFLEDSPSFTNFSFGSFILFRAFFALPLLGDFASFLQDLNVLGLLDPIIATSSALSSTVTKSTFVLQYALRFIFLFAGLLLVPL